MRCRIGAKIHVASNLSLTGGQIEVTEKNLPANFNIGEVAEESWFRLLRLQERDKLGEVDKQSPSPFCLWCRVCYILGG